MVARRFGGFDGAELAWTETGSGRTLVFLPGFGGVGSRLLELDPVRTLAEQGYRVILPDSRGCGDSAKPDDPAGYPSDVLADDGFALIKHLGLGNGDYDLGGILTRCTHRRAHARAGRERLVMRSWPDRDWRR